MAALFVGAWGSFGVGGCAAAAADTRAPVATPAAAVVAPAGRVAPASAAGVLRHTVALTVRADPTSTRDFSAALHELLLRIGVDLATAGAEAPSDAALLARIKIDFAEAAPASVVVQDAWSGEVRLHRALTSGGSRSIDIETAAHIVYTAVETLAREQQREMPAVVSAPQPNPVTSPTVVAASSSIAPLPRASEARLVIEVAPFYALHPDVGPSSALNSGAGIILGAGLPRLRVQPSVWFSAEYRLPFNVGTFNNPQTGTMVAVLRAQTTSLRLSPMVTVLSAPFAALRVGALAGIDILALDSNAPFEGGNVSFVSPRVEPLVGASALGRFRIAANIHAFVAAAVEYDLARRPFQFTGTAMGLPMGPAAPPPTGEPIPALPPWHFSTVLGLAISVPVL